ncbi:WbqC family protein [Hymenobacter defluvii]|uniref:WbqC family protein n=1 Tax=Hymenobacter defluvii TaxID=2054411 RepID=A0ABS3TFT3_9BACT|nr:WbqC family protein [Hymenobacter defluvii]MBO3272506.1 WbqC family protein [Hymenobacter defluvii]
MRYIEQQLGRGGLHSGRQKDKKEAEENTHRVSLAGKGSRFGAGWIVEQQKSAASCPTLLNKLASSPVVIFESQYNPPIAFFAELVGQDTLLLEAHDHYRKQTYRNRCLILTAQGVKPLTVPVVDGNRSEKIATSAIEIDYRQNWVHQHWRTLQTAYGGTPYFEYYADYLHDIYYQRPTLLFDLNTQLLRFYLRSLRLRLHVELTQEYISSHPVTSDSALLDRRDWLTPKAAVADQPDRTSGPAYPQTFGVQFVPNLSILDLLFMQGPAAGAFLT